MPRLVQSISQDVLDSYEGYNEQDVGLGLISPNIYASKGYQKKKITSLIVGGISQCVYAGFDHDPMPDILSLRYVAKYNCILGLNLRYATPPIRREIMRHVLRTNSARIRSNQPIMIDWEDLSRRVNAVQYITRLYKVVGINVKETIPLTEWPQIATAQTPFDGMWRRFRGS